MIPGKHIKSVCTLFHGYNFEKIVKQGYGMIFKINPNHSDFQ